jgi:hypothetical protein
MLSAILHRFALPALFVLAAGGCLLDGGEDRRPEILPGRYRAEGDGTTVEYDFREDGSFAFRRTENGRETLTEAGAWEYRYVGPEERYLIESDVTRRDLGSDSLWRERTGLEYRYPIRASDSRTFHLDPGSSGMHGAMGLFLFFLGGSGHVVFHRQ